MKLVLIESPSKKESVAKYLGKGFKVMPTMGHVRDLPVKKLGVNVLNHFEPQYEPMADKKKVVDGLKAEASKAEEIYLATDPDREGEAIAWHVAQLLHLDDTKPIRITFNAIEENAVKEGLAHPRPIDHNLVDAQQARRVLDRLVGYKLSPILCKKIQNNLSAGRVQSVTLRLLVDRDREIENFKPEEYYTLTCTLLSQNNANEEPIKAILYIPKDKKISTKEQMDAIVTDVKNGKFVVKAVKRTVTKSHPSAPFTTPTMQQEALNKLGMDLKTTTSTAQTLYEGVDVAGEGKVPLVTYIRTDSVRVSPQAQEKARAYITEKYGKDYVPTKPNVYKSKKDAQDAHEAIRPIYLERTPESLKDKVGKNYYKLYKLIYDRFLASQMADATYNSLSVDIENSGHKFKTTGRTPIFDGYTKLYNNTTEEDEENVAKLPNLQENEELTLKELKPEQKFTKPPARFTEATLVKMMEEKGIGRPATYTQTVNVLYNRHYAEKKGKQIISTELGRKVVDMLMKYFENIMDVGFTADMEDKLDDIEYGGKVWQNVVGDFYKGFEKELKVAQGDSYTDKIPDEPSDEICEKCGARMVVKHGKFGKFLACPNYPKCKNTKQIIEKVATCPKCGGDIVKKFTKTGKVFYGCANFPKCDYTSWEIPANQKCETCGGEMYVKYYKNTKVYTCPHCHISITEKLQAKEENEGSEQSAE